MHARFALALALAAAALAGDARAEDAPAPARPVEFVVTLFHFNIQYVAGRNATEDAIVRESFAPLLTLYEAHPDWGADFEMQAYMLEVLAKRHPTVLERFVRLVNSGQVELVCCHYSDQLVLAYPREDLARSVAISDRLIAKHGMKRSGVIFLQEGQTGPGVLAYLKGHGYPIAVHARGSYDYFQPGDDHPLLYRDGDTLVVPAGSERPGAPATLFWGRLGDGELVVAEGNPYGHKGKLQYSEEKARGYEEYLGSRARRGAKLVTITRYVDEVRALGVEPPPIGPYLDTPWKGPNGENVYCWLGRQAAPYERDVEIASTNYRLSREALAVEALLAEGVRRGKPAPVGADERIERAWKYLLLAEVSDAAGWLPVPIEVGYAAKMQDRCTQELAGLARDGLAAIGLEAADVRLLDGSIAEAATGPSGNPGGVEPAAHAGGETETGAAPDGIAVTATAGNRALTQRWTRRSPDRWLLEVEVVVSDTESVGVEVGFPLLGSETIYSPAGLDDQVVAVPNGSLHAERWHLALANGLIGLGQDWFVAKHNRSNHVACRVDVPARRIAFVSEAASAGTRVWRFDLVRGPAGRALEIVREVNTAPTVRLAKDGFHGR